MMSRRDYEAIARAIRRVRERAGDNADAIAAIDACVDELRYAFLYDLPGNFDQHRFVNACAVEGKR